MKLSDVIKSELIKLKRSYIFIPMIVLPIISIIVGDANFYLNQNVLRKEWYSLWTQVGLFYGDFFYPVTIGICAAFLCRMEYTNKNWNKVFSLPLKYCHVIISKLIVLSIITFIIHCILFLLYFISGKILGFTGEFPGESLGWFIRGYIASISIGAIQLFLSIKFKSFAVPIGFGFILCFAGLFLYVNNWGMFFPHSLLIIGLGALNRDSLSLINNILFVFSNLFFIIVFLKLCVWGIKKEIIR